jgi:GrpB-like predicted nucleotidyltransferase (UPF0157 family)
MYKHPPVRYQSSLPDSPMPQSIPVELQPYSYRWAQLAEAEGNRLGEALRNNLVVVHHIGSTAIPGICAKPVIDLCAEVISVSRLDGEREQVCLLGYQWWGEYGISGRRFCTLDDQDTGKRRFHLHCFESGDLNIEQHVAFRDYLKAKSDIAREYESVKVRARELYANDSHAYSEAKSGWINSIISVAVAWYGSQLGSGSQ